jgi:hypothetical protein
VNPDYRKIIENPNPKGIAEKELVKKYPELKQAIVQAEINKAILADIPSKIPNDSNYKRFF